VAANTTQRSLVSFPCGTESHLGERELASVGKWRNVAPIDLSPPPTVKVNLVPSKGALDKGDASDLSIEEWLSLRRQDLAHCRDQALLQG
jgi:hypothetical protein